MKKGGRAEREMGEEEEAFESLMSSPLLREELEEGRKEREGERRHLDGLKEAEKRRKKGERGRDFSNGRVEKAK